MMMVHITKLHRKPAIIHDSRDIYTANYSYDSENKSLKKSVPLRTGIRLFYTIGKYINW